jgi:hypothetical protein
VAKYPSEHQYNLPDDDTLSPDQEYYVGWQVQHSRLWVAVTALSALLALSLFANVSAARKFQPVVQYVTLEGGYVVTWNERSNPVINDVEYVPARLRAVATAFVGGRYAWDHQDLQKLNSALRLMSPEARDQEQVKIREVNPAENVVAVRLKVDLEMNWGEMRVTAEGSGRFRVYIPGQASISDAIRHTGAPAVRPVTFELVIQTVPANDINPLGYVVVATGRDII